MTAVDGDPLTGDPTGPDVRHLLDIIPARRAHPDGCHSQHIAGLDEFMIHDPGPTWPTPLIHEPCIMGQCGGCTAHTCRTRTTLTGPAQEMT